MAPDPVFYYLGLSGLLKYAVYYCWRDRKPSCVVKAGHVTKLLLYPLKSARGISMDEIHCLPEKGAHNGAVIDRQWMVTSGEYDMVSSRQVPAVSLIQTRFEGAALVLSAPGVEEISIDIATVEETGKLIKTEVHGIPATGLDCGESASQWISDFVKKPGYRIVYARLESYRRGVIGGNKKYLDWTKIAKENDKLAYHDSISFHLCAEESTSDLNTRLTKPVDETRFRPNIIVSTAAEPYDEDTWHEVFIGEVRFTTLKLCARCVLPTVDPTTGEKDKAEDVLCTLNKYRSLVRGIGPAFGIDMVVERPGVIRVGDPIYIVRGDNISKP